MTDHNALVAQLRKLYTDHGTNYVQLAADTVERLDAQLAASTQTSARIASEAACERLRAERAEALAAKYRASLESIIFAYDFRSELTTTDADCAGNLCDLARVTLGEP